MSRGTRAVLYFFFAVVSLLLGSVAVSTGFLGGFGGSVSRPVAEIYGAVVRVVAVGAPVLFVGAAFYALLFGRDP